MKLSLAVERLLPREVSPAISVLRQRYGHAIELVAFRRRLIVDLIR
jgi:hypothetical protein